MSESRRTGVTRRGVIAGAGVAAIGGMGVLAGCGGGSSGSSESAAAANDAAELPTYIPYEGLTADLPGDPKTGVDPAFRTFPEKNPTTVEETPGDGSTGHQARTRTPGGPA